MFIFCITFALCVLTVFTDRLRRSAMSETDLPSAIMRKTWNSRSESAACGALGVGHGVQRELLGHLGADVGAAAGDLADRGDELRRGAFLGEVARGPGADRAHRVLVLLVHGEDENAQLRLLGVHLLDELDAALAGHRHVEQQEIELELAHALHHLVAVARLAHDLEVARRGEQLLEPLAHDRVVVGDDDADHVRPPARCRAGAFRSTQVPRPGTLSISTCPPSR